MSTPNILVFGGPNSGKTHYAAQLYGRLRRKPGKLAMRVGDGTAINLKLLEQVLSRLEEGNAADHTPLDQYSEIRLPLKDNKGSSFDLDWPDYGGEQISQLFERREVSTEWRERLKKANGWVLFIRLDAVTTYPDALSKLTSRDANAGKAGRPETWDDNAYFIELIQILSHVAGYQITFAGDKPPLAIVLSCYDEVHDDKKEPALVLQEKLPLFASFIHSIWAAEKISVWGVSALGKKLTNKSNDDDFIDNGPEQHGWIVTSENEKKHDLTEPLAWVLERR